VLGARIAIDDFGMGYSSLSHLQRFPATSVKIDRTLVSAWTTPVAGGLARSILAIGRTLGLTAIAQGVETVE
jgi:EAL domain-containing protein (putative c-di-GMP-specific phosphodiesterase class I)